MSLDPSKMVFPYDILGGTGGTQASTGAGAVVHLPPGKKAVQIFIGTGAVVQLKVQNSIDVVNWCDISSSSANNTGTLYEVDSVVPKWRTNYSLLTTAATTASPNVAVIAQLMT